MKSRIDIASLIIESLHFVQGRPLLRANLAIKRHAAKIYTCAMLEQFGLVKYCTNVGHFKWKGGGEFDCECGQFAHMGLLCCHVLKVDRRMKFVDDYNTMDTNLMYVVHAAGSGFY